MRTVSKGRNFFLGTHKRHDISIEREKNGRFYIIVTAPCGMHAYEGWAPDDVTTMAQAKQRARIGAGLDRRKGGDAN